MEFFRIFSVDEKKNTVIINKKFFEALFIDQSLKNNRTLSSVSIRLAALLLQTLDEFEAKELPPRKWLAERLNTSRTSIINALVQLEECNFIIRQVSIVQAIVGPSEEEKKRYYRIGQEHLKQRNFSDKFMINRGYNQKPENLSIENLIEEITSSTQENINNYITNEFVINKLRELEERVSKIEKDLKE